MISIDLFFPPLFYSQMEDIKNKVDRQKKLFLERPNEHLGKYPILKDCVIIEAAKDSKSVLDVCGV